MILNAIDPTTIKLIATAILAFVSFYKWDKDDKISEEEEAEIEEEVIVGLHASYGVSHLVLMAVLGIALIISLIAILVFIVVCIWKFDVMFSYAVILLSIMLIINKMSIKFKDTFMTVKK